MYQQSFYSGSPRIIPNAIKNVFLFLQYLRIRLPQSFYASFTATSTYHHSGIPSNKTY